MGSRDPQTVVLSDVPYNPLIGKYGGDLTGGGAIDIPTYYLPTLLVWIGWDYPSLAATGVDIDYKLTGYDWLNRSMAWSVTSGPGDMTIDADSTLHWTPTVEGSVDVTVQMVVGTQAITKQFTILVDNSRVVYVDGVNGLDTNDGTEASPMQTLYAAFDTVVVSGTSGVVSKLIYLRDGNHVIDVSQWANQPVGTPFRKMSQAIWSPSNFPIVRGYPGESAVVVPTGAGCGGLTFGGRAVVSNLTVNGGDAAESAGINIFTNGAIKRCVVSNYQAVYSGNCTGVKLGGGGIMDSTVIHDCYDRANLTHHNSSNFLFYGTSAGGDTFVIDSIVYGSVVGYKIKHAGSTSQLHIHRSVAYGCKMPYGGADNRSSLRHSLMVGDNRIGGGASDGFTVNVGVTDPSTGGEINLDKGMLLDNVIIVNDDVANTTSALGQASYAFATGYVNSAYYNELTVMTGGSGVGAAYLVSQFAALPVDWTAVFRNNEFITAGTDTDEIVLGQSTQFGVGALNNYGVGNTWSNTRRDLTFDGAGSAWIYDESASQLLRDGVPV